MTNPAQPSKELDEIYPSWQNVSLTRVGYIAQREKAKAQINNYIKEQMLSIVGPNDQHSTSSTAKFHPRTIDARNDLRDELRQAINERFK